MIRSKGELRGFVLRVTALAIVTVLVLQGIVLSPFIDAADLPLRLLVACLTTLIVTAPIALTVGRAQMRLFEAKAAVELISRTDPLTGLANRRAFMEAAFSTHLNSAVMLIADIDRFKSINDTYGHLVGDVVIEEVGDRLRRELGDIGIVGRLGGEEFAVLAVGIRREDMHERLVRLLACLSSHDVVIDDRTSVPVTISVGVAFGREGRTVEQIYADADQALYIAKVSGRDRFCYFDEESRVTSLAGEADDVTWVDAPSPVAIRSNAAA